MNLHVNLIFFQLNKTVNQIVTYQTLYMRYVLYDVGISAVLYALSFFDCQKKQILFIQSCSLHSMAGANLNKCVWLVTNTTTASKYIPRRTRISINWNPPFQTSLHKSFKNCYEVNLVSHCSHLEVILLIKLGSERGDSNWCRFWSSEVYVLWCCGGICHQPDTFIKISLAILWSMFQIRI